MPLTPQNTFSQLELQPGIANGLDRQYAIGLAPSQTLARGTVMGELASTDAVYTITITAATSGGFFTVSMTVPSALGPTAHVVWSATNATLLANLQAALNTTFGLTGGQANLQAALGTITAGIGTLTITGRELYGNKLLTLTLADSTTGGTGTTIASTTTGVVVAPGQFKAYASGNTDGSQIPKCLLMRDCISDANGNITESPTAGQTSGQWGQTCLVTDAYYTGVFRIQNLTGLDANAVTVLGAKIILGNLNDGGLVCL